MSGSGQSRPRLPALAPPDVRYAPLATKVLQRRLVATGQKATLVRRSGEQTAAANRKLLRLGSPMFRLNQKIYSQRDNAILLQVSSGLVP